MAGPTGAGPTEGGHSGGVTEPSAAGAGILGEPGRRIADRYFLRSLLGRGAHGEVWEADDALDGRIVAVKLINASAGGSGELHPARLRREVAVLRMLRLQGVVQLLDEGVDGRPYIVMERVAGRPFPGVGVPCTWGEMADAAVGLVETLGRIHASGVVHRDLKPGNVLVAHDGTAGRATILDFGVSYFESPAADRVTAQSEMIGTPAYLAPEQISGDQVTPRTDLYALGVMLYEALTGKLPHQAKTLSALMRARLTQPVPRIREVSPAVPATVAEVIDQLLVADERDRPRSAAEVASRLRGETVAAARLFPWLGPRTIVDEVTAAALAGRSVDVRGGRGSGRSRVLREVTAALAAAGRTTVALARAWRPYASLEPVVGALDAHGGSRYAEVRAFVEGRLAAALAEGTVLVVDDADAIDPASADALARAAERGAILGARRGTGLAVTLQPLSPAALADLFSGPNRILHLREDAAHALHRRTGGMPGRVADEVGAWVRAGIARWDGDRLVIDRDGLDYLDAGFPDSLHPAPAEHDPAGALPHHLDDLLAWLSLAGTPLDAATLAAARKQAPWMVEAELAELARRDAVTLDLAGRASPRRVARTLDTWDWQRRRGVHADLAAALAPGSDRRLHHLLAAGEGAAGAQAVQVAREAGAVALRLATAGRLGQAKVTLLAALRTLRAHAEIPPEETHALLSLWVDVALGDVVAPALDRVLYEITRTPPSPETAQLERLVRAALACSVWTDRAMSTADEVPPFADPRIELRRQGVRVSAARRSSLAVNEQLLADLEAWGGAHPDGDTRAALAGWLGRLRYRQGRYEDAARLHDQAAAGETWLTARIAAQLNSASALLEAHRLDECARRAAAARDLAAGCRHAFFEARAEWLLRCAAHRACAAGGADLEFVDAVGRLRFPEFEIGVYLIEAAIAFHAGDRAGARRLVELARRPGPHAAEPFASLLADAFWVGLGGEMAPDDRTHLARRARECASRPVAVQALGLLALGGFALRRADVEPLAAAVPVNAWPRRREILSIDEALGFVSG